MDWIYFAWAAVFVVGFWVGVALMAALAAGDASYTNAVVRRHLRDCDSYRERVARRIYDDATRAAQHHTLTLKNPCAQAGVPGAREGRD